jgi:DtxR family transcriptional regulator, Mn-dependent transcriptional regulator
VATSTVENYLKQLYVEQRSAEGGIVALGRLAAAMGVVPGTATSMVKALSDSGLVRYEPRGGVALTPSGQRLALHVLRRHRLIELFLVEVLELDWSEVHEEADQLEHAVSDLVLERMDAFLGHPRTDPHGDPIPSARGRLREPRLMSLATCAMGVRRRIARILDQDRVFLQFIQRQGLRPGAVVTVARRDRAADAVRVRLGRGTHVSLGLSAAAKILVEAGGTRPPRRGGQAAAAAKQGRG